MKTTKETSLPVIQKRFMETFDGTIQSVAEFDQLNRVLNPTFCAHYFFVSGTCDSDTITTRDTDGSFAYWGSQTEEQMTNAYVLAEEVKAFIMTHNPMRLDSFLSIDEMREYGKDFTGSKKSRHLYKWRIDPT